MFDGSSAPAPSYADAFIGDAVCSDRARREELLAEHIERRWLALAPQSRHRLAVLAASTITSVEDVEHARLLGALAMIAESEGTLSEETEFAETYLGTDWVCEAIADADRRKEQVRDAVRRHRAKKRLEDGRRDKRATYHRERQQRKRAEATLDARSIGVDGEGMTLPDGSHVYRYMAATDSDGRLLGELECESGIETGDALDFLAGLPRTDQDGQRYLGIFGYGFQYDLTKALEGMGDLGIYRLFHDGGKERKIKKSGYLLRRIGQCFELVDRGAPKGERATRVWDIIKGFQCSFVKALIAWQVGTKRERADLLRMKKQRGNFVNSDWSDVRRYCRDECRLLAKLTEEYIRAHVEAGIDLRGKYHGAGSTADAFLSMLDAVHKKATYEVVDGTDMLAYLRMRQAFSKAYFGGRAEVSTIGIVRGPIHQRDVASAYPHALYQLPCVRHGVWKWVSEKGLRRAKDSARMTCVHFSIETPPEEELPARERPVRPRIERRRTRKEVRATPETLKSPEERASMPNMDLDDARVGRRAWGVLPYRTERGSILWPCNHPGGYAWLPEWSKAKAMHAGVRAHGAWCLSSSCKCPRPYEAIGHYYQLRLRWSKEAGQKDKPLKLGMNGMYGKICQVVGDNPKYACRALAGHITATTRGRLLDGIASAKDPWSIIYVATDGILSTEDIRPPEPSLNETASLAASFDKSMLGGWDSDSYDEDLFIVQPGFYFSLAEPEQKAGVKKEDENAARRRSRTRGTPLDVIEEFMSEILRQWKERPTERPRELPPQVLFHGAKSSVQKNPRTGRVRRKACYGRWSEQERQINYVIAPKRSDVLEVASDAAGKRYRLSTWILRDGEAMSHDYRKDPMFALQDVIADEQPDFLEPLVRGVGE